MKKIYFIYGITASGKTTYVEELGKKMSIPVIHIDSIFDEIGGEVKVSTNLLLEKLFVNGGGDLIQRITNFNVYELFKSKLAQEFDGKEEVIIEGSQLGKQDVRDMCVSISGTVNYSNIVVIPDFSNWVDNMNKKQGYGNVIQKWDEWKKVYYQQIAEIQFPSFYYFFNKAEELLVEHNEYQRNGFTDEKWKLLNIEQDIKYKRVLDLGSNAGWIGRFCINRGCSNYLGLEKNWLYCEDALKIGVNTAKYDLNEFADNWIEEYDVVLSLASLHYIKEPVKLIEKVSKISKLFVLEYPVYNGGDTGFLEQKYLEEVLNSNFKKVVNCGASITPSPHPEYSKRFIYKCYA